MAILNAWLYDNPLTEDPNDYVGKTKSNGNVNNEDIAHEIVEEGSEVKVETIINILNLSDKKKAQKVAQGHHLNTPLCNGYIGLTGAFRGKSAKFEKGTHRLVSNFSMGSELRAALETVTVDILGVAPTGPVIGNVEDSLSGELNSIITPNNVIKVNGSKIKIEGDDANVGIWFVNVNGGNKVKVTQLITNERSDVVAMVPALEAGSYELELVTQGSGGGTLLKEARSITFEHILTVQ